MAHLPAPEPTNTRRALIESAYVRKHPTLWDSTTWSNELQQQPHHLDPTKFCPDVFVVQGLLPMQLRENLMDEVDNFVFVSNANNLPRIPPSIFCGDGCVLNELGLQPVLSQFVADQIDPLVTRLFPDLKGIAEHDLLAFVVRHHASPSPIAGDTPHHDVDDDVDVDGDDGNSSLAGQVKHHPLSTLHADDSCITVNICLGENAFQGGEIVFATPEDSISTAQPAYSQMHQFAGQAVLHRGRVLHDVLPVTHGSRMNLILWLVSQQKVENLPSPSAIMEEYVAHLAHILARTSAPGWISFSVPIAYMTASRGTSGLVKRPNGGKSIVNPVKQKKATPKFQASINHRPPPDPLCHMPINQFIAGSINILIQLLDEGPIFRSNYDGQELALTIAVAIFKYVRSSVSASSGSSTNQTISLHFGDSGFGVGCKFWEYLSSEHGLDETGFPTNDDSHNNAENTTSYFDHLVSGRYVPRALFCSTTPANYRPNSHLGFHSSPLSHAGGISHKPCDLRDIRLLTTEIEEKVRLIAEDCDHVSVFRIFRDLQERCGWALSAQIVESLRDNFPNKKIWAHTGTASWHNSQVEADDAWTNLVALFGKPGDINGQIVYNEQVTYSSLRTH
jgi:hypothetical protein